MDFPTPAPTESQPIPPNDAEELKNTIIVYGSILVVGWLTFCWARLKYPRTYNVRSWAEKVKTPLAENQFGFFSWMWETIMIDDDEFLEECGMDALCFTRVLMMGVKLCCLGMFNAIWLMPLYGTAIESDETDYIEDVVVEVSIAHVREGSPRLIGTAIAAYMVFGYAMYLIMQEFEWFIGNRHKFLAKRKARNYAVYVRNIPEEYRGNRKLEEYFRKCFRDEDSVLEGRVRIDAANLEKKVIERDALVVKLEHAIAVKNTTGIAPTHSPTLTGGGKVDSISTYREELKKLQEDLGERITSLDASTFAGDKLDSKTQKEQDAGKTEEEDIDIEEDVETQTKTVVDGAQKVGDKKEEAAKDNAAPASVGGAVLGLASTATSLLSSEDGELYGAGFVVFTKLSTCQIAQQTIHSHVPFSMEVLEAPDPEDVIWANVGKTHQQLQLGRLLSFALTTSTCLLWTIPMAFFASLSSVDALKEEFDFLRRMLENSPWLEPVLAQIAPLLVVIFNSLLTPILTAYSNLELPISLADVQGLLFSKLAMFMIIQTFFVSAISGGIVAALADVLDDPTSIVSLLANSLPAQSTYFIQLLFVSTAMGVGFVEALRVAPVAIAFIHGLVGPKLTEKQRNTAYLGLRPLSDPVEFLHAAVFAQAVLYFMVFFVYSVVAPITNYFLVICFLFMCAVYRHHFVYVYPTRPDSGGKLWINFLRILLVCILIAQITIFGLLGLKKATIGAPMMIPLIIVQVLFGVYIKQMHFVVASYLPTPDCMENDLPIGDFQLDFRGAYVQPELKALDYDSADIDAAN